VRLRSIAATMAVIVGVLTFSAATASANSTSNVGVINKELLTYNAGRYIVTIGDHADIDDVLNDYPIIQNKALRFTWAVHGFAAELTSAEIASLSNDVRVNHLAADEKISIDAGQSRTISNSGLWGLDRIDQRDLPLNNNFSAVTNGEGVYVYVVDSGVRTDHNEFSGRVESGYFAATYGTVQDCDGHGTHVAGTAVGTNVGVAPGARLIPVRVMDCNGEGSVVDIVAALEWIGNDASRRPAVVNMSLGGLLSTQQATNMANAINGLIQLGVPVVVAAGNSTIDACDVSPAQVQNAITVAASVIVSGVDRETSFSNYGSCVDLFAPGQNILSSSIAGTNLYYPDSGTSMAAPHVAGAIALYLESNPTATPAQVWDAVRVNATGCAVNYPTARAVRSPNRLLYVGLVLGRPCPPSNVVATTGSGQSLVSWSEPEGLSGTANLAYTVSTSPASPGCTTTSFSCTLTGLVNGQSYVVAVTASNASVTSNAATTTVTPEGVPIAPTVTGVSIGNGSATVSWGAVPSTSAVSYVVTSQPGGQTCTTSQLSCEVSGLVNGATYSFSVTASNVSGSGAASALFTTTLYTVPPSPNINRIRTKSRLVTLRWDLLNVPYAVRYTVRVAGTNRTCSTELNSCTVKKLTNGKKYRLTVTASNFIGDGAPSQRTATVVPGINVLRNTVPKKKKILLTKFMTTLSKGRVSYKVVKGQCKISSGYLVAPKKTGRCTLQLSVSSASPYPSMSNTAVIQVT
jgi:subtilisin family serine protease